MTAGTLGAIYQQHRQGLYTLALAVTRCSASAEDAVQEAFARLCRDDDGHGRPPSVAYVFAAVRNAAIDQIRRAQTRERPVESIYEDSPAVPNPADASADAEQQELVRRTVETLPDDQRQTLVMKVYGGLTFQEIGQVLGEPLQTVASRYRRALERLREKLQKVV